MLGCPSPSKPCDCKVSVPLSSPPAPRWAAPPTQPVVWGLTQQQHPEHPCLIPWGILLGWEGTAELNDIEFVLKHTIAEGDLQSSGEKGAENEMSSGGRNLLWMTKNFHSSSFSAGLISVFYISPFFLAMMVHPTSLLPKSPLQGSHSAMSKALSQSIIISACPCATFSQGCPQSSHHSPYMCSPPLIPGHCDWQLCCRQHLLLISKKHLSGKSPQKSGWLIQCTSLPSGEQHACKLPSSSPSSHTSLLIPFPSSPAAWAERWGWAAGSPGESGRVYWESTARRLCTQWCNPQCSHPAGGWAQKCSGSSCHWKRIGLHGLEKG